MNHMGFSVTGVVVGNTVDDALEVIQEGLMTGQVLGLGAPGSCLEALKRFVNKIGRLRASKVASQAGMSAQTPEAAGCEARKPMMILGG